MHAGMGVTWLWKGEPGATLSAATIGAMYRFLRASGSSMKVLGGARFDSDSAVAPEWEPYGSFCMILPALELVRIDAMHVHHGTLWAPGNCC